MRNDSQFQPNEPEPPLPLKPSRRRFSDEYKLRILEEADAASEFGQVSALLRREGLYSSYLVEWRQQRARGELGGPEQKPVLQGMLPLADQFVEIEKENRRLLELLRQAEIILDIQEKTLRLFGVKIDALKLEDRNHPKQCPS